MQVTYNSWPFVQCRVNLPRRCHSLPITAACLILMSLPPTLRGQGCDSVWTCNCSTVTMNSNYCSSCAVIAESAALGCAYSGDCNWTTMGDSVFQQCMAQMQPPPPPAPTATPSPGAQCMVPEVLMPSPLEKRRAGPPVGQNQRSQPQRKAVRPMSSGGSFPPCSIQFVDPVPSLQTANPAQLKSDDEALANLGSPVYGIAADGVAQVVLRIGANYAGQQITLSMLDEAGKAVDADVPGQPGVYGWLSSVNGNEHVSQLPVTAKQVEGTYMAFAVYHAPIDFSRSAQTPTINDDAAISRTIQFNAVPTATGDTSFNITSQLTVWRPPVVLVHGLWADESSWLTFSPFVTDNRFFIGFVDYSYGVSVNTPVPPIINPLLGGNLDLSGMRANSLGFDYNAPFVLDEIQDYIRMFRTFRNAAAAQADIVAHSMGGVVARTLIRQKTYASAGAGRDSFGQGSIHKLITIGTPHYGTKLAGDLLASPCMAGTLAYFKDMYSFRTATMNGASVNGAVGDLQGDGKGGSPSAALSRIDDATQIQAVVPTAMIAGEVSLSNLAGLDSFWQQKTALRLWCGSEPLAQKLASSSTWPTEFDNLPNDGIVPVSSQLHSSSPGPAILGVVHSQGCLGLGFTPPFELGPDSDVSAEVQIGVIGLLNASLYASPNSGLSFTLLH